MIKNYFITAIRHIKRDILFSSINIIGLAIGMSCSILIMLWVYDEISFDKFHENSEDIYRTIALLPAANVPIGPVPLGERLVKEYPEIINSCNLSLLGGGIIKYGEKSFDDIVPMGAEPSFFDMFSFEVIAKTKDDLLSDYNEILLTESLAKKIFGDEDPLGKILNLNVSSEVMVTAIIKDLPDNSHIQFDAISHFYLSDRLKSIKDNWFEFTCFPYLQLEKGVNVDTLRARLENFYTTTLGDNYHIGQLDIQALEDIHLHSSDYQEFYAKIGDAKYVLIFSIVSVLILVIACINFMNLSTAKALKRVKDIGVRKVSGAYRKQIIFQYLGESFIISFVALMFALLFVDFLLPVFNAISQKNITMSVFTYKEIIWLILIAVVTGLVSGSYTAIYLSKINPLQIFSKSVQKGRSGKIFRQVLVVLQFSISIALIIFSISIQRQMHYMQNKDLGYNIESLYAFNLGGDFYNHYKTIKEELKQFPEVTSFSLTDNIPVNIVSGSYGVDWEGREDEGVMQLVNMVECDEKYLETMEIELVEGRNFRDNLIADTSYILINETAAKVMGFDEPIGKQVSGATVVGVIKDFHFRSMHTPIAPLILRPAAYQNIILIRVSNQKVLPEIVGKINELYPDYSVAYESIVDAYSELYYNEKRIGEMFDYFSILAIFLSCLGLFGLSAFTSEQRTKEIGIRKALGSTNKSIVFLLEKEFIRWIIISNVIAWPVTYYFVRNWLDSFTYRINVSLLIFLISSLIALLIAVSTVFFHAYKSSSKNPVDCLRYE